MDIQSKTPLFDKLISHKDRLPISLHVPGHKNGSIFPEKGVPTYRELLRLDITELTGLDDLHSPEGVIQESQQLLADLYGVKKSYLLVNGTTVGNLAMIMATINEEDIVLVQRNCHKSILNGLQLVNAHPVFLNPEYDDEWKVPVGPSLKTVKFALTKFPDTKAIILTYPNYYGMVYPLEKIIQLAHENNIPVLVDEAHGAHFIAGSPFPVSAVTLGADIVVQSAHKTLPAMTMGSFLHFNSQLIQINHLEKFLHILQSSSPSYPIMASLDLARSYLGTFQNEDLVYLQEQIDNFRMRLSNIQGIKVLSYGGGYGDLLRITIQSTSPMSGFDLQKLLEKYEVFAELADPYNLLFIVPLVKVGMNYPFEEIVRTIKIACNDIVESQKVIQDDFLLQKKELSKLKLSFKEMKVRKRVKVTILQAVGKICAEMIVPYPPGIPLLFPGEIITEEDIVQIRWLLEKGGRFQGGELLREGFIHIY